MIRIPQVRVVDEEGAQLGVMATPEALAMAQERGLDLVEVAPMAAPPVVKFLDFGQYKYELTKRDKEAKRKQRSVTFKEVRLKPKIGIGDFDTKVRRAIQFLEEGDRIKVAVQFRGRELTHPEIGRSLLTKFSEQIKDHGVVERSPLLEGKTMHITVASTHKPKVIEHVDKHGQLDAGTAPSAPAASGPTPEPTAEPATAAAPKTATPVQAPAPTPAAPTTADAKTAEPKPAEAKTTRTRTRTTDDRPARATTAATTTTTKTTKTTKPASRPTRTRKTTEPEASAPAPAGE